MCTYSTQFLTLRSACQKRQKQILRNIQELYDDTNYSSIFFGFPFQTSSTLPRYMIILRKSKKSFMLSEVKVTFPSKFRQCNTHLRPSSSSRAKLMVEFNPRHRLWTMVGWTGQTHMGSVTLEMQHGSQLLRNGAQEHPK